MAFLRDNQSPTQESLTQAFLNLNANSHTGFFTRDLLRHSVSQRVCTRPQTLCGNLPPQSSLAPRSLPTVSPLGSLGGGNGAIRASREEGLASVPHQTAQGTGLIYEKRLLKYVRAPAGEKIICINKVLLWESGRPHVGKVIKIRKNWHMNLL